MNATQLGYTLIHDEFMEFGFIIILYVFVWMYVLYIVCVVLILNGIVMLTVSMYD
jgi:hypothetical protein